MKRILISLTLCMVILASIGCGKEKVTIGNKGPEVEVQKCLKLSQDKEYEDAIQCFEMFKARYPQSREGLEAELLIGDSYFDKKDYLLAAESYAAFIKLHPTSSRVDYAFYRRGVALFKESPKAIDRDQQYLTEAIENLATVVRRYPGSTYAEPALKYYKEARLRLARRNLYVGRFYFRTGEYKASLLRLKEVSTQYKDTGLAPKALYMLTEANLELGDKEGARDAYSALSTEYPGDKYTKKAEKKMLKAAK